MKLPSLFFLSALTITLVGCDPATPPSDEIGVDKSPEVGVDQVSAESADQTFESDEFGNLAKMAFEYLKTADEEYLEHIWVTPELMKRIGEITGQEVSSENLEKHQAGIVESAKLVRKEVEELGIDWSKAKLVKAEREASGETTEYAPPSREDAAVSDRLDSFEVYLTIESGEATVKIRLDDCLGVDGKHVIGDCFLAPNMEGW